MTLQRRICKERRLSHACEDGDVFCLRSLLSVLAMGRTCFHRLSLFFSADVSFCPPLNWPLLSLASFCSSSSSSAALWHLLSAITRSGNRVDSSGLHPSSSSLSLSLNPSVVWWITFSFCLFFLFNFCYLIDLLQICLPSFSSFHLSPSPESCFCSHLSSPVCRVQQLSGSTHTKHQYKR